MNIYDRLIIVQQRSDNTATGVQVLIQDLGVETHQQRWYQSDTQDAYQADSSNDEVDQMISGSVCLNIIENQ